MTVLSLVNNVKISDRQAGQKQYTSDLRYGSIKYLCRVPCKCCRSKAIFMRMSEFTHLGYSVFLDFLNT